ncbi:MAG: AAA family ATPase [Candidatus Eiseniibacteriota bacterium]
MTQQFTAVIIDSEDSSRQSLITQLRSLPGIKVEADADNLALGMKLARQVRPTLLFVEAKPLDEALAAAERFHLEHPSTAIFITSADTAPNTILRAMRAGAKEFLARPVANAELASAVDKLLRIADRSGGGRGKVIATFSNKGGVGTTSVAVNLAVALARVTQKEVALADLDIQAGDVSIFLNARPAKTIADVCSAGGRIDSAQITGALVKHGTGVYVLAGPERPEQTEVVKPARVNEILSTMRDSFPFVVVDNGHGFSDVNLEVFDAADQILVVVLLNLPSIRGAQRCLDVFRQLGYLRDQEKVRLVVNRYLPQKDIGIEQLEEALHYPVFWRIPNDYANMSDAINAGMPVAEIDTEADVTRSYDQLASALAGLEAPILEDEKAGKGFFEKILRRGR